MELVTVKTKFQAVIPQSIRKRVRLDIVDLLEASFENGKIAFTQDSYRPAFRGGDRGYCPGPPHGLYASATEAISALERRTGGRNKKPTKRK